MFYQSVDVGSLLRFPLTWLRKEICDEGTADVAKPYCIARRDARGSSKLEVERASTKTNGFAEIERIIPEYEEWFPECPRVRISWEGTRRMGLATDSRRDSDRPVGRFQGSRDNASRLQTRSHVCRFAVSSPGIIDCTALTFQAPEAC